MTLVKSITFDSEATGLPAAAEPARASEDAGFLDRLRAGQEEAFELLVERYSGDIYAVLYRLTDNPEEAADLTQDTFLRALRSIRSFRGDSGLKTWLIRIAINESHNRFRWWKRRRRDLTISFDSTIGSTDLTFGETVADGSINPEQAAQGREREAALEAALLEINPVYREALVLCDIEGMTYEETAAALGTNIGTVKSRISRAREELRKRLKDF